MHKSLEKIERRRKAEEQLIETCVKTNSTWEWANGDLILRGSDRRAVISAFNTTYLGEWSHWDKMFVDILAGYRHTLASILQETTTAKPKHTHTQTTPTVEETIAQVVRLWQEGNHGRRLTLTELYLHVRQTHGRLTVGQFHDALVTCALAKQVHLGAYTLALATCPDSRLALYYNQQVHYYVSVA